MQFRFRHYTRNPLARSASPTILRLSFSTFRFGSWAPRKIASTRRTPQNCLRMIPLRSRSDSFTFTPGLSAIASESNFSRCPFVRFEDEGAIALRPGQTSAHMTLLKPQSAFHLDLGTPHEAPCSWCWWLCCQVLGHFCPAFLLHPTCSVDGGK